MRRPNYLCLETTKKILEYNPTFFNYIKERNLYNDYVKQVMDILHIHNQPLDIKYEELGDGMLFHYPRYSISFWSHDDKNKIITRIYKDYTKNI